MKCKVKVLFFELIILIVITLVAPVNIEASNTDYSLLKEDDSIIMPRGDIIEWRFKVVNGKLYKRQYNCTRQCWIGNWELC